MKLTSEQKLRIANIVKKMLEENLDSEEYFGVWGEVNLREFTQDLIEKLN